MTEILARAQETLSIEIEALKRLMSRLDEHFENAVDIIFQCRGKVVVTGMGKSGLIGRKIAATFTSTGTPALFLHPAESSHGDLGIISAGDVVIAISFSGETAEILHLIGHTQAMGVPLIGISGKEQSTLANHATVFLDISVEREACPLGLSPTTSTTCTLALGDALAMCLLEKRNFRAEDFALFHPGGSLGKKLTITVGDLMLKGEALPIVVETDSLKSALHELNMKTRGIVIVIDALGKLSGVFSVGDLMRLLDQGINDLSKSVQHFIKRSPKVIHEQMLAAKALHIMETFSITVLVVVDAEQKPIGLIQIYDILRAGVY